VGNDTPNPLRTPLNSNGALERLNLNWRGEDPLWYCRCRTESSPIFLFAGTIYVATCEVGYCPQQSNQSRADQMGGTVSGAGGPLYNVSVNCLQRAVRRSQEPVETIVFAKVISSSARPLTVTKQMQQTPRPLISRLQMICKLSHSLYATRLL